MESVLSIFKIGVGPSSSHTIGPMVASNRFIEMLEGKFEATKKVQIALHGSLCLTGKGHMTDIAAIVGLTGVTPKTTSTEIRRKVMHEVISNKRLNLGGKKQIEFSTNDIIWNKNSLPLHENGMKFSAFDEGGNLICEEIFYSTGGGFVSSESELKSANPGAFSDKVLAFDFDSALRLEELCNAHNKRISDIVMLRECELRPKREVLDYCLEIYDEMLKCYENGVNSEETVIPGGLNLHRLAPAINKRLNRDKNLGADPLAVIDYISMYARAIAEENAAGGRVVTAPTNGSCGVVPAVLLYMQNHRYYMEKAEIIDYLLTCAGIGYLYKRNASISGAEAGCQAEIGVASSMAAAGMALVAGLSTKQVLQAAEIAMEHHLGLTCDPIGGLVQIPCIERNTLGAIKAISACKLAQDGKYDPHVSLDQVIITMYKTGRDMNEKYRETSLGGLAKMAAC